jgi:hypothetical protein
MSCYANTLRQLYYTAYPNGKPTSLPNASLLEKKKKETANEKKKCMPWLPNPLML